MTEKTNKPNSAASTATAVPAPAAKPAAKPAAAQPPKKLVPRVAPKAAPAKAAAAPAAKPTAADAAVEQHRQDLAAALVEAKAGEKTAPAAATQPKKTAKPAKAAKPSKAAKPAKPAKAAKVPAAAPAKAEVAAKAKKPKLVRDSYAMPEAEYALIGELKKRLVGLGVEIKKSELLRAGVLLLATLADGDLKTAAGRVERIKTGRPARK